MITSKAYISAVTVTNISTSFYLQNGGKKSTGIDIEQNYVIVTLCNTQREVTSHNLWSRYDRHIVGITRHNVCS